MPTTRYLIVGGGMTADAAVRGIRERDPGGSIGVIAAEVDPPYNRPPLSKALWKGDPLDSIWRKTSEVGGVTLHLNSRAVALDAKAKQVRDDHGNIHLYTKLLLATGAAPRRLPMGGDDVIYYRTVADYRRVRKLADDGASFGVIGGGFIGSEVAAALAMAGCKVTMFFPDAGIGARLFPADLSANLVSYYREHGVDVRAGESVVAIDRTSDKLTLRTASGLTVAVDSVVAGVGVVPDVDLAKAAGIVVNDGIVVDEQLRTSHSDVFAAGDVARFHAPSLGVQMRVEHEDNANTMGRAAGLAMAGDTTPYTHLPFFYSDLFDLGYEAVGETDSRSEIFADWKEPFQNGVVYYLKAGRLRGVLLWGIFGQVDAARALIAAPGPFTPANLKGRISG